MEYNPFKKVGVFQYKSNLFYEKNSIHRSFSLAVNCES